MSAARGLSLSLRHSKAHRLRGHALEVRHRACPYIIPRALFLSKRKGSRAMIESRRSGNTPFMLRNILNLEFPVFYIIFLLLVLDSKTQNHLFYGSSSCPILPGVAHHVLSFSPPFQNIHRGKLCRSVRGKNQKPRLTG